MLSLEGEQVQQTPPAKRRKGAYSGDEDKRHFQDDDELDRPHDIDALVDVDYVDEKDNVPEEEHSARKMWKKLDVL